MKPRHQVSPAAIELIKRFEGYRRKAAQLPDGRWTIGYGHTLSAREGAEVSESDAEALLLYDLIAVAKAVNELTFAPLSQNQFDALCAFVSNIGVQAFTGSQVLKRLNEGQVLKAACALELWRKAEFQGEAIVIDALVRRRSAEKTLFLTPPGDSWPVAPTPLLKPELDADAAPLVPRDEPTALVASLDGDRATVQREVEPEPIPGAPIEDENPVSTAAEAVTARLETLFQDEPPAEPEPEPEPEIELAPAEVTEAEADVLDAPEVEPLEEEEPPFELLPPEPELEPTEDRRAEPELVQTEPTGDLFEQPANDGQVSAERFEPAEPLPPPADDEGPRERIVIDDTAPFEFVPVEVQPIERRTGDGLLSLVVLAIAGLAFFAGGLFWAVNAQPGPETGLLTPRIVGALACIAGVGLFSITVYLLLQRLGRER
ncbi:lysozyme [Phenylobacterium sp.]|uniref:lysozyme n=1 Tax=Phenylobacterium sp. TaxID=1871053 RepID=UPI002F924E76